MNILLNGVGRIGKSILRILESDANLNIVAINELNTNIKNIAYSINYDSTYGKLNDKYSYDENSIFNSKNKIIILNQTLEDIDYSNIDIIIDASGSKINKDVLDKLPVKAIFLTHPNKEADINVILGVNEEKLEDKKIISTSSCNATALMPILKDIDQKFGIQRGDIVTIHPLLNHQKTLDSNCVGSSDRAIECNFEFGRSATQNIIPSKTTTIEACSFVETQFNHDLISSSSLRVPTSTVGVINLTIQTKEKITQEIVIGFIKELINTQKSKIYQLNSEELVSSDFQCEEYTTIIDERYIQVIGENQLKLIIWYDNEYGYASKVVDIINYKLFCKYMIKS